MFLFRPAVFIMFDPRCNLKKVLMAILNVVSRIFTIKTSKYLRKDQYHMENSLKL